MKLALYTVLCLVCNFVAGQTTYFNNRYDNGLKNTGPNIIEVSDGYIVAGEGVDGTLSYYYEIVKIDRNGNEIWEKKYGEAGFIYSGGTGGSLIKTYDENFADAGIYRDTSGKYSALLIKFDTIGDTLWTRKYTGGTVGYAAYNCKQTPDSGFILVGTSDKVDTNGDILLLKTDKDGNFEWEKTYGGAGIEFAANVLVTADSGYLVSGYTNSFGAGSYDAYVVKTNDSGDVQWSKTYGGPNSDGGFAFVETSDGYYLGGGAKYDTVLSNNYVQRRPSIIKIDTGGNLIWQKSYGTSRYESGLGIILELPNGNFISAGGSNNNKGTPNGNGWPIGHIIKLTAQGDSLWYREFEYDSCEKNEDYVRDMKPTSDGGFIIAGFFGANTSFQCNDTGTQDMWVLKLDSCGCPYPGCDIACSSVDTTGVEEFQISDFRFQIYPNPTDGKFIIEMFDNSEAEKPYKITVYDVLGREIKHIKSKLQRIEVDISGYGKGMYFIQVGNKQGFYYTRIVKH